MILRYYGHAMFSLQTDSGVTLITDPYGYFRDYPKQSLPADVVTVSHHHHDHDGLQIITGEYAVIDRPGRFTSLRGITITGIPSHHDKVGGAEFGENTIFRFDMEGLSIVHLGDLGHIPTAAQCKAIGVPDVLLIPIGGVFTLDAAAAVETVRRLLPRIVIPMHYRTQYSSQMVIEDEKPFLHLMGAQPEEMALCRLTSGDMSERPPVLLMRVTVPDATA